MGRRRGDEIVSVEIIGITSNLRSSPVPSASLDHLASLLKDVDATVYINAYGQAWGPSSTQQWDAGTVAQFVMSDPKHVWIDWCGWPGYWQVQTDGTLTQQGASGWASLSEDLGYKWLAKANFVVPDNYFQNPFGQNFPLARGWDLGPSQNGVYYTSPSTLVYVAGGTGFSLFQSGDAGWYPGSVGGYALIADVHHGTSMGHYIYAAANPTNFLYPGGTANNYVAATSIAQFVAKMLEIAKESSGERSRSGIGHGGSYNVNTPPPVSPSGPGSPYKPGQSPGHQYSPPPPRPTIDWVTAAEVAGVGAAVGAAGFFVAKAIQDARGK